MQIRVNVSIRHRKSNSKLATKLGVHALRWEKYVEKCCLDLCSQANVEGCHTNHCLRATTCSLALGKGPSEGLIMNRKGHRDVKSVHDYQRESDREHEAVCDVLQGSKSSFLDKSPQKMLKQRTKKGSLLSTIVQLSLNLKNSMRNFNKYQAFISNLQQLFVCIFQY